MVLALISFARSMAERRDEGIIAEPMAPGGTNVFAPPKCYSAGASFGSARIL